MNNQNDFVLESDVQSCNQLREVFVESVKEESSPIESVVLLSVEQCERVNVNLKKKRAFEKNKEDKRNGCKFQIVCRSYKCPQAKKKTTIRGIKWVRIKRDTSGDLSQLKT